jgi:GT2 family glycosyltransferase
VPTHTIADPLVSIIIINYNGRPFLAANLDSLATQTYSHLEVIVVDNQSTDDSVPFLEATYPSVRLIRNTWNAGYSIGFNTGLRHARGHYILLLNEDTCLDPRCVEHLVQAIALHPTIGMCACKVLRMHTGIIDSVGLMMYGDGMCRARGGGLPDHGQYDTLEEILAPSGSAAFYRKTMLDQVGGFDEDFGSFLEDLDFGLRARLHGWKALLVPSAIVYHHHSAGWSKRPLMKWFLFERNRIWLATKNFPRHQLLQVPLYTVARYIAQAKYSLFRQHSTASQPSSRIAMFGASDLIKVALKANIAALSGLPRMLRKRRRIYRTCYVTQQEINRWFNKFSIRPHETVLSDH